MPDINLEQNMPECFLQVIFAGEDSVLFNIIPHNVTPMQLFALSDYLRLIAETEMKLNMAKIEEKRQMQKIVIPGVDPNGR